MKKRHSDHVGEIGLAEDMFVHRHAPIVADDIDMTRGDGVRFHVPVAFCQIQPWSFGDFVVQIEDAVAEFDHVAFDGEDAFEQHDAVAAVADHDDVAVGWLAPPEGGRPAEDEHAVMVGWFHAGSSDDGRFAEIAEEPVGDGGDANQSDAIAKRDFREEEVHERGAFFLSHGDWFP